MSSLRNRKIKIWSPLASSTVVVFQDGTAADVDATSGYRFDDAFRSGAQEPGSQGIQSRHWISSLRVANSYDTGQRLELRIDSDRNWAQNALPGLALLPNSKVEFWADAPAEDTSVDTPSWHLNQQSGQVRYAIGWVETVQQGPNDAITVVARGPMYRANDVRMVRDGANGIRIAKIAFNVELNSPDYFYGVKRVLTGQTVSTYTVNNRVFAIGDPQQLADAKMTGGEMLAYLQLTYQAELQAAGVMIGTTIFDAAELTTLSTKPPPIILEDVGFSDAVRQILAAYPDLRIVIDPRTLIWHLVPVMDSLQGQRANISAWGNIGLPPFGQVTVDTVGLFSATPGADGNKVRIVSGYDPSWTQEVTVATILGTTLRFVEELAFNYTGGYCVPLAGNQVRTKVWNYDTEVEHASLSLGMDLRDTFAQVRVTSVHQETEQRRERYDPTSGPAVPSTVQPAWNASYNAFWKPGDQDRESDMGADGTGIPVYDVRDGMGPNGGTIFTVEFRNSAYRDRHVGGEWVGTSLWIVTKANANHRQALQTFRITSNQAVADVGNGNPGMEIEITAETFAGDNPTFHTQVSAPIGLLPDKIILTASLTYSTTTAPNGVSAVGMYWQFTENQVQPHSTSPHQHSCTLPQFNFDDGSGTGRKVLGQPAQGQYPPLNETPHGTYQTLATGGLGATHVWRRVFKTAEPLYRKNGPDGQRCDGGNGWQPPKAIEVEIESTTTKIRQAVYPTTPGGWANILCGVTRERLIPVQNWFSDAQNAFYQDLARRMWNNLHHPHMSAQATLIGALEHAAWIDLSVRAAFRSSSLYLPGSGAALAQFWAPIWEVTLDVLRDEVLISCDNRNGFTDLAATVFEDYLVKERTALHDLGAAVLKHNELPACLSGARDISTSPFQCDTTIGHGSRNTSVAVKLGGKDNYLHGSGEIGGGTTTAGGGSTTHGARASETGFRDLAGQPWLVTDAEAILPVTEAGGVLTRAPSAQQRPYGAAQQAQATASGMAAMWGLTPVTAPEPVFGSVEGRTESNGLITYTLPQRNLATNALVGGTLEVLDFAEGIIRGSYPIVSNSDRNVVVEWDGKTLPSLGTPVRAFYPAPMRPDPTDFPNGGIVVKDSVGQLAVLDGATGVVSTARPDGRFAKRDATAKLKIRVGPQMAYGSLEFDKKAGLAKQLDDSGSVQVGYADPYGNTNAKTVHQALAKLFAWAIANGYSETPIAGAFDFSNDRQVAGVMLW